MNRWIIERNKIEKWCMIGFIFLFISGIIFYSRRNVRYVTDMNRWFKIYGIFLILVNLFCLIKVIYENYYKMWFKLCVMV